MLKDGDESYIILNENLKHDPVLHLCTLAEEVGHHLTGTKSNFLINAYSLQSNLYISLDELKARLWAVKFLVPSDKFRGLVYLPDKELAAHFGVTQCFIQLRRLSRF